ncbi:MAG: hypothetical protein U0667_14645 [Chloroflexota bacterium]
MDDNPFDDPGKRADICDDESRHERARPQDADVTYRDPWVVLRQEVGERLERAQRQVEAQVPDGALRVSLNVGCRGAAMTIWVWAVGVSARKRQELVSGSRWNDQPGRGQRFVGERLGPPRGSGGR